MTAIATTTSNSFVSVPVNVHNAIIIELFSSVKSILLSTLGNVHFLQSKGPDLPIKFPSISLKLPFPPETTINPICF